MKRKFLNISGQTSIEYVLLLAVLMVIMIPLLTRVKDSLIGRAVPCAPDDKALGCIITRSVSSFGTGSGINGNGPSYRYFRLRK